MAIPDDDPHRLPIESQLRAWSIPVRSPDRNPDGILVAAADNRNTRIVELVRNWKGTGMVLTDRTGTRTSTPTKTCLLPLPLRREELFDCLCVAAGRGRTSQEQEAGTATQATNTEHGLDILLVEDNQVNQLVASSLLKKLGHRVGHAENGRRALEALRIQHYDLILMDCQMPVMDGYEATRAIRNHPEWQSLPIIAVTGNVMEGDKQACLAAGMNDYVTKPYNREQLRAVIARQTKDL